MIKDQLHKHEDRPPDGKDQIQWWKSNTKVQMFLINPGSVALE